MSAVRIVQLVPADGWHVWEGGEGGSTPHRAIGFALTDAGTIELAWWSGERVKIGTDERIVTEPGDWRYDLAGSAAEAMAARYRDDDDETARRADRERAHPRH